MKRPHEQVLFGLFVLTLSYGTGLSLPSIRFLPYYVALYFVSFICLLFMKYGENFFRSFDEQKANYEKKIIVAGSEFSTGNEKDEQENRFLSIFEPKLKAKRTVLSWVIFGGSLWFLFFQKKMDVSLPALIPLVCSFLIINTFFSGHLLAALSLNAVSVLMTYEDQGPLRGFIYIFLFFLCLSFLWKNAFTNYKKVLMVSLLFLTVFSCANKYFEDSKAHEILKAEIEKKAQLKVSQFIKEYQNTNSTIQSAIGNPMFQDSLAKMDILQKIDFGNSDLQKASDLSMKNTLSEKEKRELGQALQNLSMNAKDIERSFKESALKSVPAQMPLIGNEKLTEEQLNSARSFVSQTKNMLPPDSPEAKNILDELLKAEEILNKASFTEDSKELKQQMQKIDQMQKELTQKTAEKFNVKPLPPPPPVEPNKEENETLLMKLKRFAAIALLFVIGLFVLHLLRKKPIKRIQAGDEQILAELQSEWRKLRKLSLGRREEVIHYYNLFHESIKKIHYHELETPPSCIVREDMKSFTPELKDSSYVLTEIYAQCFYGEKEVTIESLKKFRKALNRILKVYQLT